MDMNDQKARLETMRKSLKNADMLEYEMPMNDDFFDRMHDQIMAKVEQTQMAPAPAFMNSRNLLRAHWRGWLYPTGGITSLLLLVFLLAPQVSKVNQTMQRVGLLSDGIERIVSQAVLSPDELSQTFISSQSDSDFFMDVASESFENLSVAKFNKIMGESVR